jgi:hypothetical protein
MFTAEHRNRIAIHKFTIHEANFYLRKNSHASTFSCEVTTKQRRRAKEWKTTSLRTLQSSISSTIRVQRGMPSTQHAMQVKATENCETARNKF